MSDEDRTTPLGLFNYARSYWQSGVRLHEARAKVTHPHAPVTLLLAHAIELYLKAFLRLRGLGIDKSRMSAFGGKADIERRGEESPLMTQSGHANSQFLRC